MSSVVKSLRSWPLPRALALAFIAAGAAGCSDATRFNENPYSSRPNEVTGSVQQGTGAPVSRVQSSQLPPPTTGTSTGGYGVADPVVTGAVQGQPKSAHLPPPRTQHASKAQSTQPSIHTVAPGETLIKISRMYDRPLAAVARINNIPPHTKINIGDRIIIPGSRSAAAPKKDAPKVAQAKPLSPPPKVQAAAKSNPKATVARADTTESVGVAQSSSNAEPAPANPVRAAKDGAPSFRWPAKGRVIAGFGPRTNGQQNDGINLAVPEGTPVKAAEDGVVAYAGNELKGYGNLVLVRHANGYVTAYAHAREVLVKRGDQIKRGQIIARSGQTGNVDAPQLHFEIRKGPTPLDPMPLLTGG
jgi:murein DD-endopeptidase MepM/ murein hydrolase activator NlpD